MEAIRTEQLVKQYGKSRGISGVDLTAGEGEFFGFIGPNGAGKSTTIRILLGLIEKTSGNVRVLGEDPSEAGPRRKILSHVGYLPSEAMFYPGMTVKEVIRLAADMRKLDCRQESEALCERLQVDVTKKVSELSLGNRKKVSIVCAMQHKPKLFIFDEPTSGLDPLMQTTFFSLIDEYVKAGATCLLSTHVLSEVKNYCDRVAIMKEGRLMCVDTVENLTRSNAKRIKMVRDGEHLDYLYKGDLNKIKDELIGHDISDILIEDPSIDEVFMHYYEGK